MNGISNSRQTNLKGALTRADGLRCLHEPSGTAANFLKAARPFYLLIYMIAFAYTKDCAAAELLVADIIAAGFKVSGRLLQSPEEFKLCLTQIALSEAQKYIDSKASTEVETALEDIAGLLTAQQPAEWRAIPSRAVREHAVRGALIRGIQELSPATAVALLLRDAFHFTKFQIAGLMGESQQKVQARIAYGRIALCAKLACGVADHRVAAQPSLAAAY